MHSFRIKTLWPGPNALGEGPLWHVKEKSLYWVDIAEHVLYRLDPLTQDIQSWKMPALIGSIAPRARGGLIAGIGDEICFIDLPSGRVHPQIKVPGGLRLNDGKCDRKGRFWIGNANPKQPTASLYRYDPDGTLHTMQENIYISNGLGWSLDNRIFYYTDSLAEGIFCYDFNFEKGEINNKKWFVKIPIKEGEPDGLTVDAQGYIWSARWNGWKIVRYTPDGKIDREIKMPVQRPTSCTFGGEHLDILFITSCSHDLQETAALPAPAGALFAIELGIKGAPEPEFLG